LIDEDESGIGEHLKNKPRQMSTRISLDGSLLGSTRSHTKSLLEKYNLNVKKGRSIHRFCEREDLPFSYNLSWMQRKYSPKSQFYYKRRSITPKRSTRVEDTLYYRDVSQRERKSLKLEAIKEVKKDVEFRENCTFHPNQKHYRSRSVKKFIEDQDNKEQKRQN